tara:strand:- start:27245 stop:27745 length:501 start_codon:yes stop_codon:yes gene_type:complete
MKRFAAILLFLFTHSFIANAQINENIDANIIITANVIQSIELITVNSISFGNAQPGQSTIYINPLSDINAGYMIAVGTPDVEFRLDYEPVKTLSRIDGPGSLSFQYEISANDIEDQSSSEVMDLENRSVRFNTEGRYYFWVGGRVNLTNAQPGNYEGDFTIEIDYI